MKKIVSKIGNILCILVIIVLAIFELLKLSNMIYILQVQTGSMETNIHVGDYILVKKTDDYKQGDIITFKINNYYVTHRISSIDGDKIVTKGDANNAYDDEIYKSNVIGKVIYKGAILNFIFNYRPILVFIAIVFFIISWILEDKSEKSKKENKEEVIEELQENEENASKELKTTKHKAKRKNNKNSFQEEIYNIGLEEQKENVEKKDNSDKKIEIKDDIPEIIYTKELKKIKEDEEEIDDKVELIESSEENKDLIDDKEII